MIFVESLSSGEGKRSASLFPGLLKVLASILILLLTAHTGSAADTFESSEVKGTLVILGASYAREWPVVEINGCDVVNKGIGGNQSFEMLARFQSDVLDLSPDAVIIWGFINDIFRSTPEQLDVTKTRIKRSFEEMILQAESHGIKVIVATEVPMREKAGFLNWAAGVVGRIMGRTSYQTMINQHVSDVNSWLVTFAESRNILALDFQTALADSDGQRNEKYTAPDGSHLTAAAYKDLTVYAEDEIQSACNSAK